MFGFVALGAFAGVVVFGALFIITRSCWWCRTCWVNQTPRMSRLSRRRVWGRMELCCRRRAQSRWREMRPHRRGRKAMQLGKLGLLMDNGSLRLRVWRKHNIEMSSATKSQGLFISWIIHIQILDLKMNSQTGCWFPLVMLLLIQVGKYVGSILAIYRAMQRKLQLARHVTLKSAYG